MTAHLLLLDDLTRSNVLSFLPAESIAMLRETCRTMRERIPLFDPHSGKRLFAWGVTPNDILLEGARRGSLPLCRFAMARGANKWNWMLGVAAERGHRVICKLARRCGATDFNWMLHEAASGGHRELCELAMAWEATDWNAMLGGAASGGHRELCELAKARGATDWDSMLGIAAGRGHREIYDLAKAWGGHDSRRMFEWSETCHYEDILKLMESRK